MEVYVINYVKYGFWEGDIEDFGIRTILVDEAQAEKLAEQLTKESAKTDGKEYWVEKFKVQGL